MASNGPVVVALPPAPVASSPVGSPSVTVAAGERREDRRGGHGAGPGEEPPAAMSTMAGKLGHDLDRVGRRIHDGGMSIAVELADLPAAVARAGFGYLVTVDDDGRPRVLAVATSCHGTAITTSDAGRSAPRHVASRPGVTLVYPPTEAGGMSLLVDGAARVEGAAVVVTATRAVWHRAAPSAAP